MAIAEREQARVGGAIRAAIETLDPKDPEAAVRAAIRALLTAFGPRQRLRRMVLLNLLPSEARDMDRAFIDSLSGEVIGMLGARFGSDVAPEIDAVTGFALSRALLGAVRSAILEDRVALDDPRFEAALVAIAMSVLPNPHGARTRSL